jgi:GH43 family beta-xylosidase
MLGSNLLAVLWGALCVLLGPAAAFTNPIRSSGGSDPFLVYTGGYFYLMTTTWTDVEIARATTIDGLKTATKKVVYSTSTASRCCNVWAPEVHYFDGAWYIYYTAGDADDLDGQNIHVLKGVFHWFFLFFFFVSLSACNTRLY